MRNYLWLLGLAMAISLMGCSGSGDDGEGISDLSREVGLSSAEFVLLDINDGTLDPRVDVDDLTTNKDYQRDIIVFRRIEKASTTTGANSANLGFDSSSIEEAEDKASLDVYYMSVFELTQAQWQKLAGSEPWAGSVGKAIVDGSIDSDGVAAYAISHDAISSAISSYNSGKDFSLRMPTDDEWEHACLGGADADSDFSWGSGADSLDSDTVQFHAVTKDTTSTDGPSSVGSLRVNGYGLYDMHGNVWEWTDEGNLRGGSWRDDTLQARAANIVEVDVAVDHPLAGCRLSLEP